MTASFWSALADYTSELAPVAGPLLSAVSDTAAALDRASSSTRALRSRSAALEAQLAPAIDVPAVATPSRRRSRRASKPRSA